MTLTERARRLLPGLWAGWLTCVALLATPAPFALLAQADAGRVAGRMLAQDAYTALALGAVLLILERQAARRSASSATHGHGMQFSAGMALVLGAVFCTVAGYFALQPMMVVARTGGGLLSFGQLHAVSAAFFIIKLGCVAVLAWRAAGVNPAASS